jgi:hypothetical protein
VLSPRYVGESLASSTAGFVTSHILRYLLITLLSTETLGASLILLTGLMACGALVTTGVNAGLVGLVLSYGLNTTSALVRRSARLGDVRVLIWIAISELVCAVHE